jgi:cyclopropane fatty-acyl-phospholipid synthase-like methyltransferase
MFMKYDAAEMQNHPSAHVGFTKIYAGNPPWDIGKPQPPFVESAGRVTSPVLDAGCGTGNTALFFAARGHRVTGIDFVDEAIRRARVKASERGLAVEFLVKDAMTLGEWDQSFRSVIDSGLFHVYAGDEQRRYVQGLRHVIQPGGRLFLFTFTEEAPEGGVSREQLYEIFAEGWEVESVELARGEVNPAFLAEFPDAFPEDGPKGWFAIIRRSS